MDDEFPTQDEEYEMMYADELELLNDMNDDVPSERPGKHVNIPVRRSLNFLESDKNENVTSSKKLVSEPPTLTSTQTVVPESTLSRKRTIDDIFGDIDDIEMEEAADSFYDIGQTSKRSCKQLNTDPSVFWDEEPELEPSRDKEVELIERINALRKIASLETSHGHISNTPSSFNVKGSANITKGVPKWPFVSITSEYGGRVYVRVRNDEYMDEECGKVSRKGRAAGLLRVPFSSLKDSALKILEKRQESAIAAQEQEMASLMGPEEEDLTPRADSDNLWVVKYKPRGYSELLSEESVNRTLLHWLKLWDKVVFNREKKPRMKPKDEKKGDNRFQKKPFGQVMTDELDELGRPQYKMVLLCGPPGLGKTTLAHMVAKLAGYNVVEVNASDDRSPEVFHTQLEAATQMKAVMGKDPKPNCLVLDEIDGAPAASIETLIKFVLGKDVGKGRGKKKAAAGILKRPVICICNDAYVPALRPLRQHAFVLHFPPTASERLASRLISIARKQNIQTDLGAMLALCEKTQNDIRSCLSLLHYFKSQNKPVRLSDVHQSNVGQKDMQKGLFTVWQEIFQIQKSKGAFTQAATASAEKGNSPTGSDQKSAKSSIASRVQSILRTVQGHGDYNRLIQGVFENYPNMKLRDSSLHGLVKGLDWFCYTDMLNTTIMASQNYILMPYMAYAFAAWHLLYASVTWPKINYPNMSYEVSVKEGHTKQILGELKKTMSPGVKVNCNDSQLVQEILPFLLEIIVPNFRPVSLQLFSSNEKKELCNLVSIMIDYNLTYVQERTPEGTYVCILDPNVEEIVHFGGSKPARFLNYGIKQLIAREIEMEKMRRYETVSSSSCNSQSGLTKNRSPAVVETTDTVVEESVSKKDNPVKTVSPPSVPNHLRKLKAMPVLKEMQTKDFFGRVVEITLSPSTVRANSEAKLKGDVWFHFKEGFNNAVRKTIRISELL